jgi:hypothetical protein
MFPKKKNPFAKGPGGPPAPAASPDDLETPDPIEKPAPAAAKAPPVGKAPMPPAGAKPPMGGIPEGEDAGAPPKDDEGAEGEAPEGYGSAESEGAKLISDIEAAGDAHGMSPEQSRSFAAAIFSAMADCLSGGGAPLGGNDGGDHIS